MADVAPKLFISYSWSSPNHEAWVLTLAAELRANGIDVVLDKWDLKEGHDVNAFMEKMVTDPLIRKVALICDRVYAEKADGRSGGVGVETQIISAEVYARQDQTKFVAVLPERDERGKPFLPIYYKSRIFIDLSSPDSYGANFEQLLRWVCDKPLHVKPPIGKYPAYLTEQSSPSLETTSMFRRAVEAVRQSRSYCGGALNDYFDTFARNLERFRISKDEGEFDDKVVNSIDAFLPYRAEAIELFLALAKYRNNQETWESLHRFFENILAYRNRPESVTSYQDWDWDNFRFIINELLLYAIAVLLRSECYLGAAHLLRQHYYIADNVRYGLDAMVPFSMFSDRLTSLMHRNDRLKLHRVSIHADLLEQRSKASGLPFQQVMQADFLLFIRDCLDCLRIAGRGQHWWPVTLIYSGRQYGPFEMFARCQSKQYFDKVKSVLDITKKEDMLPLVGAFRAQKLRSPSWDFHSVNSFELMAFDKMASLP